MMDYSDLINAQTWAFIRQSESFYPPDTVSLSITKQRAVYDAMCQAFIQPRPLGVRSNDQMANGVPVRRYTKTNPSAHVLFFHGGGFVVGGLDSHDDICAEICDQTGFDVVSVDYRLCPEHPHPAAYDDGNRAFHWLQARVNGPIILVGDSAGGTIAAALSHANRGQVAGQVLVYPGLGGNRGEGSYLTHANAPMLSTADIEYYETARAGGRDISNDPSFAPLCEVDFTALPNTEVFAAQCDPLCDDARAYCKAIQQAGGQANWTIEPGLVHGYLRARNSVQQAADSFARVIFSIQKMAQK